MRYLAIIILSLAGVGCQHFSGANYDAWVNQHKPQDVRHFQSVQSAIDAATKHPSKTFRIFIAPGDYYEKILINTPNIQLIGSGASQTRLFYDNYAGQLRADGNSLTTPGSATLTINSKNVLIKNLTIENSFDYPANETRKPDDPNYIANAQAVALFLDQDSDKIIVKNSRIFGFQDTLFINAGRSWFDKVTIAGHVDFIFGQGTAVFSNSEIKSKSRLKQTKIQGFVTAASTNIDTSFGLIFLHCRFTRESGVGDHSVALGRPWHPTTSFSDGRYADPMAIGNSVILKSWLDKHILLEGWQPMKGTAKNGSKIEFASEDARFFEYNNYGPGATINKHRRQLTDSEAATYTLEQIFGDWNPHTSEN